jgi:hypothetical protein
MVYSAAYHTMIKFTATSGFHSADVRGFQLSGISGIDKASADPADPAEQSWGWRWGPTYCVLKLIATSFRPYSILLIEGSILRDLGVTSLRIIGRSPIIKSQKMSNKPLSGMYTGVDRI